MGNYTQVLLRLNCYEPPLPLSRFCSTKSKVLAKCIDTHTTSKPAKAEEALPELRMKQGRQKHRERCNREKRETRDSPSWIFLCLQTGLGTPPLPRRLGRMENETWAATTLVSLISKAGTQQTQDPVPQHRNAVGGGWWVVGGGGVVGQCLPVPLSTPSSKLHS